MRPALLWSVFSVEVRKRMSYRADFWINSIVGILVQFSVAWFLTGAMFSASGQARLGGLTPQAMLLYYAFVVLMARIVQASAMEMVMAQDIYEGSLNRYLLYPVSYAGIKFAEQAGSLAPQLLQLILFGMAAPWVVGIPDDVRITPVSILMAAVSLAAANLLHYLLVLPINAVAFWADNVWSLMVAERMVVTLLGGFLLPLELFPEGARAALVWLPFPYLFSVPVRTLLGQVSVAEWVVGLMVAAAWCVIAAGAAKQVWRRGILQYSGVGI
jgi:ABC-2 type transport system permease protein